MQFLFFFLLDALNANTYFKKVNSVELHISIEKALKSLKTRKWRKARKQSHNDEDDEEEQPPARRQRQEEEDIDEYQPQNVLDDTQEYDGSYLDETEDAEENQQQNFLFEDD